MAKKGDVFGFFSGLERLFGEKRDKIPIGRAKTVSQLDGMEREAATKFKARDYGEAIKIIKGARKVAGMNKVSGYGVSRYDTIIKAYETRRDADKTELKNSGSYSTALHHPSLGMDSNYKTLLIASFFFISGLAFYYGGIHTNIKIK